VGLDETEKGTEGVAEPVALLSPASPPRIGVSVEVRVGSPTVGDEVRVPRFGDTEAMAESVPTAVGVEEKESWENEAKGVMEMVVVDVGQKRVENVGDDDTEDEIVEELLGANGVEEELAEIVEE